MYVNPAFVGALVLYWNIPYCTCVSMKKGIALTKQKFRCEDLDILGNVTWWYDWGINLKPYEIFKCPQLNKHRNIFVPMVWTFDPYQTHLDIESNTQPVLGFNEPNNRKQAGLLPPEAASDWPEVERVSKGRSLVSPSAAPCGQDCVGGNTTQWFDSFFNHCRKCRVDFIATHFYSCNATQTMSFLRHLHQRYGSPIWLTEFSCPFTTRVEDQMDFMKEILPLLEESAFIYRYAWFASRVSTHGYVRTSASLLEPNSSRLTQLGKQYIEF